MFDVRVRVEVMGYRLGLRLGIVVRVEAIGLG